MTRREVAGRARLGAYWSHGALVGAALLFAAAAAGQACGAELVTPPSLSPPNTWLPRSTADLRVLDKISAQASTLSLHVGDTTQFQTLSITLKACMVRPPDLRPDATAELAISDPRPGAPGFSGWMFSGEPFIAMLEDPVYGVQLVGCH